MFRSFTYAVAFVAGLGACNALFGVDDFEYGAPPPAAGGSGGSAGGAGGTLTSVGGGGSGGQPLGGSGPGGQGGVGGQGGTLVLEDRGLLVRYFVDEAQSGQAPAALLDSGPAPAFDVPLTYDGMQYVAPPNGRGLAFTGVHQGIGREQTVDGTKLPEDLGGETQGTMEVVFDAGPQNDSIDDILFAVKQQATAQSRFGLQITDANPKFYFGLVLPPPTDFGYNFRTWDVDVRTPGRLVAHVVFDSTLGTPDDRLVLYVDGVQAPLLSGTPPPQNEPIHVNGNSHMAVGNQFNFTQPFAGTLYYGAIYNVAFTPTEVANNAAVLTASDDPP